MDMAVLSKESTGLNNIISVFQEIGVHRPRIKVFKERYPGESVSILIDSPHNISAGKKDLIPSNDLELVGKWLDLNRDTLIKYWNGEIIYTEDLIRKICGI